MEKEQQQPVALDGMRKLSKDNVITIEATDAEHPHNWPKVKRFDGQ